MAASEILASRVVRDGRSFEIAFTIRLDAPVDAVVELLRDYSVLSALSPSTLSSRVIAPGTEVNDTANPWLNISLRPCILMFCKTMNKLSQVDVVDPQITRFEHVPGYGDFVSSREELRIMAHPTLPHASLLHYDATLQPHFYVPPFIGAWMIRRVLVADMTVAVARAEAQLTASPADGMQ